MQKLIKKVTGRRIIIASAIVLLIIFAACFGVFGGNGKPKEQVDADGEVEYEIDVKYNFGGSGGDYFNYITPTSDGFIAAGYSAAASFDTGDLSGASGKGGDDATIVKFDNSGNVVWKKHFGGSGEDRFQSVTSTSDGFVAAGYSSTFNTGDWSGISGKGNKDAIIVKFDDIGSVVWKKHFGGSNSDYFYSITSTSDGFVVVGDSASASFNTGDWSGISGKGNNDAIIVKFDNSGNVVWKKHFGGSINDHFYSITSTSDGFVAVGYSGSWLSGWQSNGDWSDIAGKGGGADATIVKFDNNGNAVWENNFGGSGGDYFNSITSTSDGFVAVGYSGEIMSPWKSDGDWSGITGKGAADAILVKFDNSGNIIWKENFGGSGNDRFQSITSTPDGFVAAGYSGDLLGSWKSDGDWSDIASKGDGDATIVKYDNSGKVVWKNNFGGSSFDYFQSITPTSDSFVAVGYSDASSFDTGDWSGIAGRGEQDATIVKFTEITSTITQISFSSSSSALSRLSANNEAFTTDATLEVDKQGNLLIIFQTSTSITKIEVDAGGNSFSFTVFNTEQQKSGITFVLTSPNAKQVSMQISNITTDITITASSENTWQVECIDEYSGSTFVTVDGSYILPAPAIPPGKTFVGWFNDKGEQVTAATAFSDITNWDTVERITRVYARWI